MKRLLVIGAGGHAKVVIDTALSMGVYREISVLDSGYPSKASVMGCKIIGPDNLVSQVADSYDEAIVAIGDCAARKRIMDRLTDCGIRCAVIVHPSAYLSSTVQLGSGSVVFANATLQTDVKVGEGCVINSSSVVEHDCLIDDFAHISPGATLAGAVSVGASSWIGAGAVVRDKVSIGCNSVVGAGAVVVNNLPSGVIAVGVPAKVIRENQGAYSCS